MGSVPRSQAQMVKYTALSHFEMSFIVGYTYNAFHFSVFVVIYIITSHCTQTPDYFLCLAFPLLLQFRIYNPQDNMNLFIPLESHQLVSLCSKYVKLDHTLRHALTELFELTLGPV